MEESSSQGDGLLPVEIVSEILLRLPVKSLCRFRCVSTLWRSIIRDPHFVSCHFARSSVRPKLLVSVDDRNEPMRMSYDKLFFSIDYLQDSGDLRQTASYHGQVCVTGHYVSESRGLICVGAKEGFQIFNPSTRECVTFPKPSTRDTCSFLGYDPVEKKYKIVNSLSSVIEGLGTEIHVLTLGEKDWRRIDPGMADLKLDTSLCVDGVMHMVGMTTDWEYAFLVLFDVRLESFQVIPFPTEVKYCAVAMCLIEFGGHVALLDCSVAMHLVGGIRLWILEDLPKQVWRCKEFVLPPRLEIALVNEQHHVVGVTSAGEVMFAPLETVELPYLYIYHMEHATLKKIEISGLYENALPPEDNDMATASYHVESLQSLRDLCID